MSPAAARARSASAAPDDPGSVGDDRFTLSLDNFEGPFDLLLQLIAKHKLDVTEVALSRVTDEFIAYVTAGGRDWDLEQTSSFLVVAATLLDLKAARLLPGGEVEDEEDIAALEARDLLFARLLQYRAFRQVAEWVQRRWDDEARVFVRPGGLEPGFAGLRPDVELPGPQRLAVLATRALSAPEVAAIPVEQLHVSVVSVHEQAEILTKRLQHAGTSTFRALTADADRLTTVVRFLALLELFQKGAVGFEQLTPFGELTVRWTGDANAPVQVDDEYDGLPSDGAEPGREGSDARE